MLSVAILAAITVFPFTVHSVATRFKLPIEKRGLDCGKPVKGLTKDDCKTMEGMGMAGQGLNAESPNGNIWIGDQGPSKLIFTNAGDKPLTLIVWDSPKGNFQASFVNARPPKVSYSLRKHGDKVTVSVADAVSGGWSVLIEGKTRLSQYGQIDNTWGEFTSGDFATVDISRLVNMSGTHMSARTQGGCTTDMDTCVFVCKTGNTCGESGSYALKDCTPGSQIGATYGDLGNPEGGCGGWDKRGYVNIDLGKSGA